MQKSLFDPPGSSLHLPMGVLTEGWRVTAGIGRTLSSQPPTFNTAETHGGQGVVFVKCLNAGSCMYIVTTVSLSTRLRQNLQPDEAAS